MAGLTLKGIYKKYPGGVVAVSDVNLEIRDKEFIVLVGPSGCLIRDLPFCLLIRWTKRLLSEFRDMLREVYKNLPEKRILWVRMRDLLKLSEPICRLFAVG